MTRLLARTIIGHFLAIGIYLAVGFSPGIAQQGASFIAHVATELTREAAFASYEKLQKLLPPEALKGAEPFIHEVKNGPELSYRLRLGPPMSRYNAANLCAQIISAGHNDCVAQDAFVVAGVVPGFYGDLLLKPLKDGRNMEVAQPFGFVDSQARKWEVPAGAVSDGASIPRAFWSLIGSPFAGKFRVAAVVHDYYCKTRLRSWTDTHDTFHEIMLASGEDAQRALLMWSAVYRFGPRWTENESACWNVCAGENVFFEHVEIEPSFVQSEFEKIKSYIYGRPNVSIEELRQFIGNTYSDRRGLTYAAKMRGALVDLDNGRTTVKGQAPQNWWQLGDKRWQTSFRVQPIYQVVKLGPGRILTMHSEPNSTSVRVGGIPHSGRGIQFVERCTTTWCRVRYEGVEGWIDARYVQVDIDARHTEWQPPPW